MKHLIDNHPFLFHSIAYFLTLMVLPEMIRRKKSSMKLTVIIAILIISFSLYIMIYSNGFDKATIRYLVILLMTIVYILTVIYKNKKEERRPNFYEKDI